MGLEEVRSCVRGREWVALLDGGSGRVAWPCWLSVLPLHTPRGPRRLPTRLLLATSSPACAPRQAQPKCCRTLATYQEARSKGTLMAAEGGLGLASTRLLLCESGLRAACSEPPCQAPVGCSVPSVAIFCGSGTPASESQSFQLGGEHLSVAGGSLTAVGRDLAAASGSSRERVWVLSWLPGVRPALLRPRDSPGTSRPRADAHPVAVAHGRVLQEARANSDLLGHDPFGVRSWLGDLNINGSLWTRS